LNESALNETCDYITAAGLNFIILFTDSTMYKTFSPFDWATEAQQKYGDKFLGVYRYDEPGGNQIDRGKETLVDNATSYSDAAEQFTTGLGFIINHNRRFAPRVFTADYALQWFDYESNYSVVFTEFGFNNTREIAVATGRGAARSFGRDWGAIITWEYNVPPFIGSDTALYTDMVNAYRAGARYVVVFDAPKLDAYGILTDLHFDKLRQFWSYVQDNPQDFASQKATAAYVTPKDYGFGLRRADDSVWGLFPADGLSPKVWNDTNMLVRQYGFGFDIVYDEPGVVDAARNRYDKVFLWNETLPFF
jgi:hypothetical protein